MNRSNHSNQTAASSAQNNVGSPASNNGSHNNKKGLKSFVGLKLASVALLFSATILIVALLWFVVLGSPSSEGKYVEDDKMQAVFLNGGQVYFGNIEDLNDEYMRVSGIYYLRVNQQVQPDQANTETASANDISLVKLGCELHGPEDEMLINREQVVFWENLKTDGQVAKAVEEYKKQNPNGQDCEAQNQTGDQTTPTGTGTEGEAN